MADKEIDAEDIFGSDIKHVNDTLSGVDSYSQIIYIAEQFLIKQVEKHNSEFIALDYFLTSSPLQFDHSIDWLARAAYLSPRQLERKFHERIGVSAKTFQRISRFNHSYWIHLKNRNLSWFHIAMNCGYTDYQHMAKEYKEFACNTPSTFFVEESKAPGRVLGLNRD